jgi:hypothetical protein
MKSGRLWVLGLLVLGSAAGVFAVWHWSRPENAVRWTFTSFHASMLPRRKPAREVAAERVILDGLAMTREDFFSTYASPKPGDLSVTPCPATPGHWDARMNGRAWCFAKEGRNWRFHRVGREPCDER